MPQRVAAIAVVAVVLVLTAACGGSAPVSPDAEETRLAERQRAFFVALSAKDADSTAAAFADDAVLHVANMPPIEGRDAIERFYGNLFRFLSETEATPESMHISAGGDMAYGTGRASNAFRGPEGLAEYTGKYVLVWRKVQDEWVIALYAVSSNQS